MDKIGDKSGAVVLSRELFDFLMGEGEIDGTSFGDLNAGLPGRFWWRALLRAAARETGNADAPEPSPPSANGVRPMGDPTFTRENMIGYGHAAYRAGWSAVVRACLSEPRKLHQCHGQKWLHDNPPTAVNEPLWRVPYPADHQHLIEGDEK